jgi:hypothetical protein
MLCSLTAHLPCSFGHVFFPVSPSTQVNNPNIAFDERGAIQLPVLDLLTTNEAPLFIIGRANGRIRAWRRSSSLNGRDLRQLPLERRRKFLDEDVLPQLAEPVRASPLLPGTPAELIRAVQEQGAGRAGRKRRDSRYESGERSGAWMKMRINEGQEFVMGGYTIAALPSMRLSSGATKRAICFM